MKTPATEASAPTSPIKSERVWMLWATGGAIRSDLVIFMAAVVIWAPLHFRSQKARVQVLAAWLQYRCLGTLAPATELSVRPECRLPSHSDSTAVPGCRRRYTSDRAAQPARHNRASPRIRGYQRQRSSRLELYAGGRCETTAAAGNRAWE